MLNSIGLRIIFNIIFLCLVLNIGTSSQVSFIMKNEVSIIDDVRRQYPAVTVAPYKENTVIITAASLTGIFNNALFSASFDVNK